MAKTKIVSVGSQYPYGRQKVDKLKPSTGIYGKRVGGKPPINAARVRKGR